jgi:transcriptional regulator with XRE-family HTH domain
MTHRASQADSLWNYDLVHGGHLYERVREHRRISQEQIAGFCAVVKTAISRFESGDLPGRAACYIEALQSGKFLMPISVDEGTILLELYEAGRARERQRRQEDLSCIRFSHARTNPALRELTQQLAQIDEPAFVVDPTLCVHALNGASLRLFNIDPTRDVQHLCRPELWNYFTCKLYDGSPFYAAHVEPNKYYRQAITSLFRDPLVRPYWFTWQMRSLVAYLHELTKSGGFRFASAWYEATSFSYNDGGEPVNRSIAYVFSDGRMQKIHAEAHQTSLENIEIAPGVVIPFRLGTWKAESTEAREAFADIAKYPHCRTVYYAASYDTKPPSFHINTWPAVQTVLGEE